MKKQVLTSLSATLSLLLACQPDQMDHAAAESQNWTHFVRIAGHGLDSRSAQDIVKEATESYVFGIEVDNSLTGYYESFLEPGDKLQAIKAAAENATQTPEQGAEISFPANSGSRILALPFLGAVVELPARTEGGKLTGRLPDIGKGLVVWCE